MKTKGKPADHSAIEVDALEKWIRKTSDRQNAVKCQALISLSRNNSVKAVCEVFGINRETLRQWRKRISDEGISGLSTKPGKGRKSLLTPEIQNDLNRQLLKKPAELGYPSERWDGKLVCRYLNEVHHQSIALRTAQIWIKKIESIRTAKQ